MICRNLFDIQLLRSWQDGSVLKRCHLLFPGYMITNTKCRGFYPSRYGAFACSIYTHRQIPEDCCRTHTVPPEESGWNTDHAMA